MKVFVVLYNRDGAEGVFTSYDNAVACLRRLFEDENLPRDGVFPYGMVIQEFMVDEKE